jgi:hypothetical protein
MADRILISLDAGADVSTVMRLLRAGGANHVEPIETIPDVLVALVDETDSEAFLGKARQVAGVRNVERDQMRFSS